jgi:DMSO/TMAO reductase YedYZ molybdopterin-dependent catalytic subunit
MASSPLTRREFLALAGGAVLAPSGALAAAAEAVSKEKRRMLQVNGYAIDAETPLDALTTYITPNDLFFVRHHWNPMYPDAKSWALLVDGEVETPLLLTLADLKRLPRAEATCVLQCAGNGRSLFRPAIPGVQWRYGAVGNARWTGVRVKDILEKAGLKATARHLHSFGNDKPPEKVPPFHRSLEIEKVLQDGIIAWEMNGVPLPALHGAPARLVVPGWAGEHWMKWLTRISPQPEPQAGFYMETAYRFPATPGEPGTPVPPEQMRPLTELSVKSNITEAPARVKAGTAATIRGFAFSGAPDIARVEISEDGGVTWQEASLDPRHAPWAWRLWSFRWAPKSAGMATLHARATDSHGSVQPKEAVWNPSGYLYNAWQAVEVEVMA